MLRRIFSIAALGLLIGCGGGAKPDVIPSLEPVGGKVTLDGNPVDGISVTFFPGEGNKGNPSTGSTDASGKYTLQHRSGKEGVPAGDYVVLFSKLTQPDGTPIPKDKTAADVGAVEKIPDQYRQLDNRANAVVVPKGGKTFDFDLKSK